MHRSPGVSSVPPAMPRTMDDEQFAVHAAHEEHHWWFTGRRTILRTIVDRLLAQDANALVLDVGSGTGSTVAALSKSYRVIGVEPSADAIRRARERFPFCEFVHGYAPASIGDRMHDVRLVTMMDVLEHVRDDHRLLSDVVHACRPGTWFVLTVPADMSLWSAHDVALGHYRRYNASALSALWKNLPVSCELLAPLNRRLEPVIRLVRGLQRLRLTGHGAAGTDLSLPAPTLNQILHRVFAGESREILRSLGKRQSIPAGRGVSLLAVLRRQPHESTRELRTVVDARGKPTTIMIHPRRSCDSRDRNL
jgi:SAM-dependent methyltransferase